MSTENKAVTFFTEEQKQAARELQQRLLSGENVPREDLIAFLAAGKRILSIQKQPLPKEKPNESEIDFF